MEIHLHHSWKACIRLHIQQPLNVNVQALSSSLNFLTNEFLITFIFIQQRILHQDSTLGQFFLRHTQTSRHYSQLHLTRHRAIQVRQVQIYRQNRSQVNQTIGKVWVPKKTHIQSNLPAQHIRHGQIHFKAVSTPHQCLYILSHGQAYTWVRWKNQRENHHKGHISVIQTAKMILNRDQSLIRQKNMAVC